MQSDRALLMKIVSAMIYSLSFHILQHTYIENLNEIYVEDICVASSNSINILYAMLQRIH